MSFLREKGGQAARRPPGAINRAIKELKDEGRIRLTRGGGTRLRKYGTAGYDK